MSTNADPVPPRVYFARAVDGLDSDQVIRLGEEARQALEASASRWLIRLPQSQRPMMPKWMGW